MRVNISLLRAHRTRRGWSQEHLATVTGLGLRTIHRIENEGVASYESVMAIASALSLDIDVLRETDPAPDQNLLSRMRVLDLLVRLSLAIMSGLLVAFLMDFIVLSNGINLTPNSFSTTIELLLAEVISGLVFGLCVLYPFSARSNSSKWKSCVLVLSGAASFHTALYILFYAMDHKFGESIESFLLASVAGGIIVLSAARLLLKLTMPLIAWIAAVIICLFGGAYLFLALKVLADYEFMTFAAMTGFCLWHAMMTMVLFCNDNRGSRGAGGDTVLAPFIRWLDGRIGQRIDFILQRLKQESRTPGRLGLPAPGNQAVFSREFRTGL